MSGGDGKHDTDGSDFDDRGKDTIKIHTRLLCIAVGDEAALELLNSTI